MNERAAIYARKSDKQDDVPDDAKSIGRQETGARAFIATKDWALDEAHIYKDDGVSGALFANRGEFSRMMRDAAAHAFEAIVFYDLDRFGRDGHKTMVALNDLADLGVSVWDFSTGVRVDLDSFEGRITANLKAEFAQQFRDQIRKHTRDAMHKKAEHGLVTGGLTFGYTNEGPKGEKRWTVNEPEAAVVRRIYTMCADGYGAREIAKALNHAQMPKPRAQQGRADGWSVSTVRAVLTRPLYRGEIVYGRTAKAYNRELRDRYPDDPERESGQIPKPEDTWFCSTQWEKQLRIVDPDVAASVDKKLAAKRERYLASVAQNNKTAPHKAHGTYLLSGGMLLCPSCGGHFEGRKYPWKPSPKTAESLPPSCRGGHSGHVYICSTRRRKPGVCNNTLALPIDATDDTVLDTIEGEVLGTRFIRELLALVDRGEVDHSEQLTADRDRLRAEVDRLVGSIAAGVPADTVAPAIRAREADMAKLEVQLRAPRRVPPDMARVKAALEQRAKQWKKDLRAEPRIARLVLRRLVGPLTLWDESKRPDFVRFEAAPTLELLEGLAPTLLVASPTGFEPVQGMNWEWRRMVPDAGRLLSTTLQCEAGSRA